MSCNCTNQCTCVDPCSDSQIRRIVDDAVADRVEDMEGLSSDAQSSATAAENSANQSAQSATQSQQFATTAGNNATSAAQSAQQAALSATASAESATAAVQVTTGLKQVADELTDTASRLSDKVDGANQAAEIAAKSAEDAEAASSSASIASANALSAATGSAASANLAQTAAVNAQSYANTAQEAAVETVGAAAGVKDKLDDWAIQYPAAVEQMNEAVSSTSADAQTASNAATSAEESKVSAKDSADQALVIATTLNSGIQGYANESTLLAATPSAVQLAVTMDTNKLFYWDGSVWKDLNLTFNNWTKDIGNLDKALNGSDLTWTDTAGVERHSMAALDTIINSLDVDGNFTFPTKEAGLAGTANGKYFRVPQGSGNTLAFIYYLNNSGVANEVAELVGQGAFVELTNSLAPLFSLSSTTEYKTMTELNDTYDAVILDKNYNVIVSLKGGSVDFYGLTVQGQTLDAAGILKGADKDNLTSLSDSTEFHTVTGEYELNPKTYIILDSENNILFDLDDYHAQSANWQEGYEFSLKPPKTNPYAPFTELDAAGKSQVKVFNTETSKEITITSGTSNETNPRPDVLDQIVWTSDREDNAVGKLFYAKAPDFTPHAYIARPKIVGWGHSFMENGRFLNRLAQLTGLYTYNFGKSSLTSEGVAARQGGVRTKYLPVGSNIPASGSVVLNPSIPGPNRIFGNAAATSIACSFAGVDGMFGWDGTNATFTRTSPGDVVPVTEATPLIVYPITGFSVTNGAPGGTRYDLHDECINLFWFGRNNISETERILSDAKGAVSFLKTVGKRFVILPEFPGGSEVTGTTNNTYVHTINNLYKQAFPENYCEIDGVDLLQNFMNHYNPAAPGDVEDINNGVTPRSLRYDTLHPSQSTAGSVTPEYALYAGADVNAEFVYNFMKLKGWVL